MIYINHIAYHVDDIERLTYKMIKDGFKFNSSQTGESSKKSINILKVYMVIPLVKFNI